MSDEQLALTTCPRTPPCARPSDNTCACKRMAVFGQPGPRHDVRDPPPTDEHPRCLECHEVFQPVWPDQHRCPRHQLMFDARTAKKHEYRHGPALTTDDLSA